jgi:intein/homing endonuclease
VGSGSENKRMPQFLLSTPEWFASEYLRAYYEGNGCVEKNCITAVTKSKELANDHLYLLLRLGIIGRVRKIFKKAANAPHHKGNWYYRITISGRELEKFVQIGFISPEKNAKLHELLKRKRDTNVDVIPEIREVVKTIYKAIRFERSSMTDSIARGVRRPSREYLKKLLAKIKERADEIRDARKEVEQLRRLPKLSQLVEVAEEKRLGSVLYREMDESWRRVKKGLVKTKFRNINRIATLVNEFCLEKEELRNYLKKVFSVIGIGLQTYDKSIYDFCYERRSDITYEKIEQAVEFAIQKYDELSFELSKIEKDIEFLELLANSDIFWDQIVSIEKIKSEHPYVYDLCVDDQVFLAGFGGVFVHNSYFIKTFLLRASLVWNANAIIIDWAGEYKPWVRQVGGKVVALARGAYLNLLDLAGMKPSDRIKQVIRSLEILTDIGEYPEQRRLIEQAMEEAYVRKGFKLTEKDQRDALGRPLTPPTLKDVQKILQEKLETGTYEFPAELENAIYKLKRFTLEGDDYFAEQSTIKLDELLTAGLVDIDLSGLPDETFRALGALTILQFIKEKMRMEGWTPEKGIRLFCLDGDEKITLANGKNVKIREAFERRMVGEKVWSFNNELKLEEDEIVKVMALPAPEKMYKIETEFGDALKVTPDHLMPVLRDGKVKWITSEEINVGDYLVCPRKINTGNELPRCIDLLKNARGVYIAIPNSPEIIKEAIKKLGGRGLRNCLKISKNRLKSLKKGAALKINEFEKIAKILGLSTQNVELRSRNKKVNLPEKLDECILYISGLIYSDGYIGKFGRIAFSNTDSGLKERFAEIVKKYGIKVSINRKEAVCGNNLLAELLKNITPEVLQSLPENLITAWLKGYADGDGSVSLKKKGKYTSPYITFSPSSFEEGELIRDLLLRIGIHSYTNIKKSRPTKVPSGKVVVSKELPLVIISGIENVKKFVEIVGFRQKERAKKSEIIRTLDNKSFVKQDVIPVGKMLKEMRMKIGLKTKEPRNFGIPIDNYEYGVYNPSRTMLQGIVGQLEEIYPEESDAFDELKKLTSSDLIFAKVVKKESYVPKDPFVYDIMTAKNHNFIANRIFSSNCVVDEAWKISKDENSDLVMIVREGRKYQFALIVASQSPTDIAEAVFSNVGTVFMLRLKFEKFLDYLQGSLRFSDYIRQKILSFGVGQCAVSMSYAESVPFSECFVIKKIEGEEPIIDYFVDIYSVLTEAQLRDETMPKSFPKEKVEFKKRLREMGLTDEKIEEIAKMIEKKARHIDAVDLVIELERRGVDRAAITSFYRELGIDDPTIVNIFAAADRKKAGGEITHVTIE